MKENCVRRWGFKAMLAGLMFLICGVCTFVLIGCGDNTPSEYSVLLLDEDKTTTLFAQKFEAGTVITGMPTPTKEADLPYDYYSENMKISQLYSDKYEKILLFYFFKVVISY